MDTKRLRERTDVLSFFINILILERGSGMKSYSNFIVERKKGNTAVASPAPGDRDPLDPSNRKRIDKKFSNPSNPPKVANPEAPKPPKTPVVKQADVSKQAAKYRRAQRVKGATGGKTTGSLSKGNLSFPGDRSGATAKAKSDIEARKGFSGSKSGGLKADEANPNVNRAVRQQRTVKQGIPDPFKSKTPAPADPFKGVTSAKPGKPSIPDPFKSATTKPKKAPTPKAPSGPGPATSQAISDIRKSMSRRGVKTTEADVAQRYMRRMQDAGRSVDPDLVGAQGVKASGAKPEMVGGSTKPSGSGARFRAQADAARDISKRRTVDLDKAVRNLMKTGDVRGKGGTPFKPSTTRKTGTPSSFKDFSAKATKVQQGSKPYTYPGGVLNPTRGRGSGGSINPSTNKPEFKNKPKPPKSVPDSKVTVNTTKPKVTLNPRPKTPLTDKEIKISDTLRKQSLSGKDAAGNILSRDERIRRFQQSRNPRVKVEPFKSSLTSPGGRRMIDVTPKGGDGASGALSKYDPKPPKSTKPPKPTKPARGLTPVRKQASTKAATASQLKNAPVTRSGLNKTLRGLGGRALGVAGAGYDAYTNFQDYKKSGDSDWRAAAKSAVRTGLGYAGGALGGLAGGLAGGGIGSVALGAAGMYGGYTAGTKLADFVLGQTRYERKKKARAKAAAAAANK